MDFIQSCRKIVLINTSRGKCVNTKDVVSGLIENKIIGACLDVLDLEEISFEKIQSNQDLDYLKKSDKVILTLDP